MERSSQSGEVRPRGLAAIDAPEVNSGAMTGSATVCGLSALGS